MEREKTGQQATAIQKDLLENWQQAHRHWLDRMQSEIALWGELGSKLATTRSATEAFDAYANPSYSPKLPKRATDVAESRNSIHGSGCETESGID